MSIEDKLFETIKDIPIEYNNLPPTLFSDFSFESKQTREKRIKNVIKKYESTRHKNTNNLFWFDNNSSNTTNNDHFLLFLHLLGDHIIESVTGTDISFFIHGEIYMDIIKTREFQRLNRINQLGTVDSCELYGTSPKRSEHSIVTAIKTEQTLRRLGFTQKEINLGIISALLHDIATVPLSDHGKSASRKDLEEENLISYVIENSPDLLRAIKKYKLRPQDIYDTVRGKGKLGDIINSKGLDIDSISYTILDNIRLMGKSTHKSSPDFFYPDFLVNAVNGCFNLCENIRMSNKQIYYNDPEKALKMVRLRAAASSEYYMRPHSKSKEAFLGRELKKYWKQEVEVEGITLTKTKKDIFDHRLLLSLTDDGFVRLFENSGNIILDRIFNHPLGIFFREIGQYNKKDIPELERKYSGKNYVIQKNPGFKPKTNTKVLHKRKIIELRKVFPKECSYIEKFAEEMRYVSVHEYCKEGFNIDEAQIKKEREDRMKKMLYGA